MYQKLLKKIASQAKEDDGDLQPPCTPESLALLRKRARIELSCDIPDEYAKFLSITNGLDWNGLMIYASENTPIVGCEDAIIWGFVEANLLHRDRKRLKDFLVFGHAGVEMYVYNIPKSCYQIIDRVSLDLFKKVPSFNHLIAQALKEHL